MCLRCWCVVFVMYCVMLHDVCDLMCVCFVCDVLCVGACFVFVSLSGFVVERLIVFGTVFNKCVCVCLPGSCCMML